MQGGNPYCLDQQNARPVGTADGSFWNRRRQSKPIRGGGLLPDAYQSQQVNQRPATRELWQQKRRQIMSNKGPQVERAISQGGQRAWLKPQNSLEGLAKAQSTKTAQPPREKDVFAKLG